MLSDMARIFEYRDDDFFCHHSRDEHPLPSEFYMHAHERTEVLYFISGDAQYLVEGNTYPLHPGDVLLMNPAEGHKLQILSPQPYERKVIHFSPSVLQCIDPNGLLLRPLADKPLGRRNLYSSEKFQTIYENFDAKGSDARIRVHMLITLANVLETISSLVPSFAEEDDDADTLPHRILQYVNENLFDEISLASVSEKFYLSQSQLNRIFRDATGTTVGRYIRVKRLLAAREQILAGQPPAAAGAACGFHDYSTFFRAYRSKFRRSPSEDAKSIG